MKRKLFHPIALTCCFMILMAVFADLSGKWSGLIKTPDGNELRATYNFKVDGDKLTGTAASPRGEVSIDNGKINGDTFPLRLPWMVTFTRIWEKFTKIPAV